MYDRTIQEQIQYCLKHFPVLIITGSRQVGKSTEVYKLTKNNAYKYVSLDNISERQSALEDPEFFIQRHGYPLIIDEIQYAPILMEVIEMIVNQKRLQDGDANGLFILTGSQTFPLMKGVTQSLAGRAAILKMMPLSYNEIIGEKEMPFLPSLTKLQKIVHPLDVNTLFKIIVRGFYPELYKNPDLDAHIFYQNYISTYIDRDISELINIKNKLTFHNFLQHIASLTSQQVNYSDIAKNLSIDYKTVKTWISILETSGIIYLLQPYSEHTLSKRITKAPKLYFCDTGLAAYLARVYDANNLLISNLAGPFMETYVMNEIIKSYQNNNKPFNGYYYRDSNQNEIDLIIQENMKLYCIEIKKGSAFKKNHVKSFMKLKNSQFEIGPTCILCNTENNYAIDRDIYVLSIACI